MIESLERLHTEYEVWHRVYQVGGPAEGTWLENTRTFTDASEMREHVCDLVELQEKFAKLWQEEGYPFNPMSDNPIVRAREVFASPWKSREV